MASDAQVTSLQRLERENAALAAAHETLNEAHEALKADYDSLRQQLDWFRRQLFGRHSEKRLDVDTSEQANLFASLGVDDPSPAEEVATEEITYRRARLAASRSTSRGCASTPRCL